MKVIKELGVATVLLAEVVPGPLDLHCYEWIGRDERFYSLVIACNETEVFMEGGISLQSDSASLEDKIISSIKVYDTKEEWAVNSFSLDTLKEMLNKIRYRIDNLCLPSAKEGVYCISDCHLYTKPALGISFKVWKDNDLFDSVCIWKSSITCLAYTPDPDLERLFEKVGVREKVMWEDSYDISGTDR